MELAAAVNDLEIALEIDLAYDSGRVPERPAPAVETTIYRLEQEGITNAVKHAGARRLEVSVIESADAVQIHVSDDGVGFDPEARVDGFGLIGMRERVALVRGTLSVDSRPGRGTTLRVRIPVGGATLGVKAAARRAS